MLASGQVLVVGNANLDLVLQGDVVPRFGQAEQLVEAADLTLGGSAALVACGLARLGVDVTLCAAVGLGFDFAVAEECGRWNECQAYASAYAERVLVVEYRDQNFTRACDHWGSTLSIVRRNVA